jgi:hypothetical protein
MYWKKLGQLYLPKAIHPKLATHTANPLAVWLEDDVYRVFFSGRDQHNRSSVGFVDIDIIKQTVVYIHDQPVFEYGPENSFYSHGVSIGNCYQVNGRRYILFMGWQCAPGQHWRGDVGRLILDDDFSLHLDSATPFISIDEIDPVSLSYPWVMQDEFGQFRMWYGSTLTWNADNGEMVHVINQATSIDGHHWQKEGLAVPYELGVAQAFSRPTVSRGKNGEYQMWFSYRSGSGEKYRIGYAESLNGKTWELQLANTGITVSDTGWDAEMIEYPFIFDHKNRRYMLYNGNNYGKTGFGLAVLENS